jgi:hypothetical protein
MTAQQNKLLIHRLLEKEGWMGRSPSGRRFPDIDEIYIFRVRDGKLTDATRVEDNLSRMRQLGLNG